MAFELDLYHCDTGVSYLDLGTREVAIWIYINASFSAFFRATKVCVGTYVPSSHLGTMLYAILLISFFFFCPVAVIVVLRQWRRMHERNHHRRDLPPSEVGPNVRLSPLTAHCH
jgi:hypothetical protein